MRSNKDPWWRIGAAFAWTAVLACAAYALAYSNREKDWRDYTPIERIAALTPRHVSCAPLLNGGGEVWVVGDARMVDSFTVCFPPRIQPGPPVRLTPVLGRVGAGGTGTEIVRGSEMEKTILACLDRAIGSGEVDVRSLPGMMRLRARLCRDEFSQDPPPRPRAD